MEEQEKHIDEAWKEKIDKERQQEKQNSDTSNQEGFEANFSFFISTLALQASIAMGVIDNPVTQQKEENLNQAKLIIDTLGILKEKTKGNLTAEEESLLENILYQLRTQYITKVRER
ncbi:MAG: DUF1844 domain-containing protein [Candidatus Omnitrophica bacterium]|nr:DUF1844 domain-containing protein [Candidatus Omnitrophota bacterium]